MATPAQTAKVLETVHAYYDARKIYRETRENMWKLSVHLGLPQRDATLGDNAVSYLNGFIDAHKQRTEQ